MEDKKSKLTEILENLIENSKITKILVQDKRVYGNVRDLGLPIKIDETVLMVERIISILTDKGYTITIRIEK